MRAPGLVTLVLPLAAVCFGASLAAPAPAWRPVLDGPGFGPGGGDLSVTLTARAERSEVGSEVSGYVALAVPLDRLAAPRKLPVAADDATRTEGPESAPAEPVTPDGEAPKSEPSEEPALDARILARLARAAVAQARRSHDVSLRRSELEGLATRARLSAAFPELRLRVVASNDQSLRLAPTLEDPERYTMDGGNDLVLEASATWRLNRLVFADEEIPIERLELERERSTEKLSALVLERLFAWHHALSLIPGADPKLRGRLQLERLEAEVELDVLTGGWFSEEVRRFPPPEPPKKVYKSVESTSSSFTSSSSTSTFPTPSQ